MSLEAALTSLSQKLNQELKAEPALRSEIVCIRAQEVTEEALLRRIAEATTSEWRQTAKGKELFRSPSLFKQLRDTEVNSVADAITLELAKRKKDSALKRPPYEAAKNYLESQGAFINKTETPGGRVTMSMARGVSPASILVRQLFYDLEPKQLAAIADYDVAVFATHPTPAQRPLSGSASSYIAKFEETERQLSGMASKASSGPMAAYLADILSSPSRPEVGKVLLRIERNGSWFQVRGEIYDNAGQLKTWGSDAPLELPDEITKPSTTTAIDAPLSQQSLHYENHIVRDDAAARSGTWESLPSSFTSLFADPVLTDPLSFAVTDALFEYADGVQKPFVASLPDKFFEEVGRITKDGRLETPSFEHVLGRAGTTLMQSDGWCVIKPSLPLLAARQRLSRSALATYVKRAVSREEVDLPTLATYHYQAGASPFYGSNPVHRVAQNTLRRNGILFLPNDSAMRHEPLAIFGSLSQSEQNAAASGKSIPLSGEVLTLSSAWMRRNRNSLLVEPDAIMSDLQKEWSEFAPTGLSAKARLWVSLAEDDLIANVFESDGRETIEDIVGFTPENLAAVVSNAGHQKSREDIARSLANTRFAIFKRPNLAVRLSPVPGLSLNETVYGFKSQERIVPFREFPSSISDRFFASLDL